MIIGLTGTLSSGKGIVSNFLKEKGFVYLSLSDEVREIARQNKIEITRKNLQDLANELRERNGAGFFAEIVINKVINQQYKKAVIDGIRNPAEIDVLKKLKNFFLISVDAQREIRFKRIVERNRESDPRTWEDFLNVDNRDKGIGEKETGQGVGRCMGRADFILINDSTLEEAKKKVEEVYEEIEKRVSRPTWDEYFIEICKTVSLRGTCNRGRVGCVVARDKQILVTGYAGSPIGLPHCDEVGHQMRKTIHEDGRETMHCVRTTHAEQNAICQAAKLGISINGSTLYCRMTPCSTCAKMIINSGIRRIVCEKKYHAGQESEELFRKAGIEIIFFSDETEIYNNQK
jgi:dCMP deaminase